MDHDRVIVALDVDSREAADDLVARLGDDCGHYKVGLELLTSVGPDVVRDLVTAGKRVFLDLKLFEIPNSVAGAVHAAGRLGAGLVTVHAMGGPAIMRAAVEAAAAHPGLRVLALTVVTSMTDADLAAIGVTDPVATQVPRLARLAIDSGCHGVVASPAEVPAIRAATGPGALIVTPGVGVSADPAGSGEHARPGTPAAAYAAGATHIVVGRGVTRAEDPLEALRRIRENAALAGG
ncbi:orotidine 5'-phosphate decarboxylase [Actinorhabdospora filicis]|uniref:Orotidine 5'-phosphate decarboxylase n=1 Tax=Actinorhabdospora filicis TaxID=1785913 RepID=A0A9W6WDE5_9ACTN|nr:orotidine-5'-phosphate decarboxylase [Actinorhabdospora filicis]GLZ81531.1 orotidine 5'-phosphate decarboxylase [Actinorhabdospora filicis]